MFHSRIKDMFDEYNRATYEVAWQRIATAM
jgi:hypothetical protein